MVEQMFANVGCVNMDHKVAV
ncbi:hypothetical protein IL54_4532 [Sphingobium sp. ba1]|nr:hypothetical protein IL54_4532 [Sphingobium sp. ba1]